MTIGTRMGTTGSLRQRSGGSWELRVYRGIDPATGRQRYATGTVHGSWRVAQRALAELVAEVEHARGHTGSVGELLERWYADASPGWAPTTAAHTRSILDVHLLPRLGGGSLAGLTRVAIDEVYAQLLACGGRDR